MLNLAATNSKNSLYIIFKFDFFSKISKTKFSRACYTQIIIVISVWFTNITPCGLSNAINLIHLQMFTCNIYILNVFCFHFVLFL